MRGLFQLLAAEARDQREAALPAGERGHIAPEFFELRHREDVFLALAPALLHVFQGDVGGHALGNGADGGRDLFGVPEIVAAQPEGGQQAVDIDPVGGAVVEGETRFDLLVGQRHPFHQPQRAIHRGQTAAAVLNVALDDFRGHGRALFDVVAEQRRVESGAGSIHVVDQQVLQLRPLTEQRGERAVAQHVGDFVPVADGVEALERQVVRIVRAFAGLVRPGDQGGVQALANLLRLLVEHLLRRFLPGEAEVALHGNHAQADGAAG